MFVGADGCKAGWFCVVIENDGTWQTDVVPNVSELWSRFSSAEVILIDVPIGLREWGTERRVCDVEARQVLGGKRASSVFPAPCRSAIRAMSYSDACEINRRLTGRALSCQSWAICSRILEVDDFVSVTTATRGVVREIHPEVCFWGLASKRAMAHSKKCEDGIDERLRVLSGVYGRSEEVLSHGKSAFRQTHVASDDILDAVAGAVTAYLGQGNLRTVPAAPETDSHGLAMEMVYWVPG